jgi:hypothetical protein
MNIFLLRIFPLWNIYSWKLLRKLQWQIPEEPLATRYNWCQGPVLGRGPAVEKHWFRVTRCKARQPFIRPWPPVFLVSWHAIYYGERISDPRPAPNLENDLSVFITAGERVAQLYPQTLGSSRPRERHLLYSQLRAPEVATGINKRILLTENLIQRYRIASILNCIQT